jgi:hypothetical protein
VNKQNLVLLRLNQKIGVVHLFALKWHHSFWFNPHSLASTHARFKSAPNRDPALTSYAAVTRACVWSKGAWVSALVKLQTERVVCVPACPAEHTHHKTTAWSSSLFEQHLLVHNHGAIRHLLLLLLCWSGAAELAQIIYLHWYIDARTPLAGCFGKHAAATVSLRDQILHTINKMRIYI